MPKAGDGHTAAPEGVAVDDGRRRFFRAALLGSSVALALYVAVLAGPGFNLLRDNGLLGSFYDVQGRALLGGHLDVDPEGLSFEGFRIDGETHTYFGLMPTLLRLPVLAASDGLDGRLTQLSMLLAFLVLLAGSAQLHWRIRSEMRPGQPLELADLVGAFLIQVTVGIGAVPLYLAGRAVVYHEAALWGAALSVAAIASVVGIVARPTAKGIVWAGILATLALNARFSVGMGPVLALAILAAGTAAQVALTRRGGRLAQLVASFGPRGSDDRRGGVVVLLVVAVLVPLALHGAVNSARFGRPFGVPFDKQVQSRVDPDRRLTLAANDGSLFGLKFVPTTLLQALRPDAVGSVRAFPFVGLPSRPATVIGDVRFDTIEPSLSATTSMPALLALTLIGIVALARRPPLRPLLGVLAATASVFLLALTIAFVTTRYLADVLPFLVLGSLIGIHALLAARPRGWLALGGVAALALLAVVVNGGAGLVSQRLLYEATESERAAFVDTQDDLDRLLGRAPSGIRAGRSLPRPAPGSPGELFVLDRCAGLYVEGLKDDWLPVERTERAGVYRLRVRFPSTPSERPELLLTLSSTRPRIEVTSRKRGAAVVLAVRSGGRTVDSGRPLAVARSGPVDIVVSIDSFSSSGAPFTAVDVEGKRVVTASTPDALPGSAVVGGDSKGLSRFSGRIERVKSTAKACRSIASRAGLL